MTSLLLHLIFVNIHNIQSFATDHDSTIGTGGYALGDLKNEV
jgi:hypothetical protein